MNKRVHFHKIFLLTLVVFGTALTAYTQGSDPRSAGRPSDFGAGSVLDSVPSRPTLVHQYVVADDLNHTIRVTDTTLDEEIYILDPALKNDASFVHLGYFGSSAQLLTVDETFVPVGFNSGYRQYEIYRRPIDSMRFYTSNRTIADLSFFQRNGGQDNFTTSADYGQRFEEGINLSINYKRYNYRHVYASADNQSTSFGIGFYMKSDTNNWTSYIAFQNNNHNESFNGGIVDAQDLTGEFSEFRSRIDVNLEGTRSRHSEQELRWHIEKKVLGDKFKAYLDAGIQWNNYFYYDVSIDGSTDSMIYKQYITDNRGQRVQWGFDKYYTKFNIDFTYKNVLSLNAGLRYDHIRIENTPLNQVRNDVTAIFNGVIAPVKNWNIDVNGHLGLGSNAGNFLIDGSTLLAYKDKITARIGWRSYLKEVGYVSDIFLTNRVPVYQNSLPKTFGTTIYGDMSLPRLNVSLSLKQSVVNNYQFWDENAIPKVLDNVLSVTQMSATHQMKIWRFGFNNTATVQALSNTSLGLPTWFSKHDIYYQTSMFRNNLQLRIGSFARFIPAYDTRQFQPINGQTYLGGSNEPFYPEWVGYISGKISTFRFVVSYENIYSNISIEENFNITNYPLTDPILRFGVRWLLLD